MAFAGEEVRSGGGEVGGEPTVALPPNLISPKRRNGTESVVIPGTTSRITITSSGFLGTSFHGKFYEFECLDL